MTSPSHWAASLRPAPTDLVQRALRFLTDQGQLADAVAEWASAVAAEAASPRRPADCDTAWTVLSAQREHLETERASLTELLRPHCRTDPVLLSAVCVAPELDEVFQAHRRAALQRIALAMGRVRGCLRGLTLHQQTWSAVAASLCEEAPAAGTYAVDGKPRPRVARTLLETRS